MNIKEVRFLKGDDNNERFIYDCIFGFHYLNGGEYAAKVNVLLAESETTEEFVEAYLNDDSLKMTEGYAALLIYVKPDRRWFAIREMFGDRCFKTISDVGAVKVGSKDFNVLIPSNRGDGEIRVAIFYSDEEINLSLLNFFTSIDVNGENTFIYDFDCDNAKPALQLAEGRYSVYCYEGLVAFVRLKKR